MGATTDGGPDRRTYFQRPMAVYEARAEKWLIYCRNLRLVKTASSFELIWLLPAYTRYNRLTENCLKKYLCLLHSLSFYCICSLYTQLCNQGWKKFVRSGWCMGQLWVIDAFPLLYTSTPKPSDSSTSIVIDLVDSKKVDFQSRVYTRSTLTMKLNQKGLQPNHYDIRF